MKMFKVFGILHYNDLPDNKSINFGLRKIKCKIINLPFLLYTPLIKKAFVIFVQCHLK